MMNKFKMLMIALTSLSIIEAKGFASNQDLLQEIGNIFSDTSNQSAAIPYIQSHLPSSGNVNDLVQGESWLTLAIDHGNHLVFEWLLNNGFNIAGFEQSSGSSIIHELALKRPCGYGLMMVALNGCAYDFDKPLAGQTALHMAAKSFLDRNSTYDTYELLVCFLVPFTKNINALDDEGYSALDRFSTNDTNDSSWKYIVLEFVKHGASLESIYEAGAIRKQILPLLREDPDFEAEISNARREYLDRNGH